LADGDQTSSSEPSQRRLTRKQRIEWLRLIRSENVGPTTFRELLNHFGGASAALDALPEMASRGGSAKRIVVCPEENAEAELENAERAGVQIVALSETGYPPWLARVDAPPPLLYVRGDISLAERPVISIVGARNGSAIGQKFTRKIAAELGQRGFVIASGLARGIDTSAHTASLERGTIAVLAGGLDVIYPPENAELHSAIAEKGLLVSERPMGLIPRAQDFPRRNRIISGMSSGVVVIEAARRSGSLITARLAGEQGREVFAVPGSPLDPRAAGTNRLLKDGATLVTGTNDIVNVLAPILGLEGVEPPRDFGETDAETPENEDLEIEATDREKIIQALGISPVDIDEVIRSTRLPARHVQVILLELDLAGRLERHGQQLVSLCHIE